MHLAGYFKSDANGTYDQRVFELSALTALRPRRKHAADGLAGSGFPEFMTSLTGFLRNDRVSAELQIGAENLADALASRNGGLLVFRVQQLLPDRVPLADQEECRAFAAGDVVLQVSALAEGELLRGAEHEQHGVALRDVPQREVVALLRIVQTGAVHDLGAFYRAAARAADDGSIRIHAGKAGCVAGLELIDAPEAFGFPAFEQVEPCEAGVGQRLFFAPELEGYADYARVVKYRLAPYIW